MKSLIVMIIISFSLNILSMSKEFETLKVEWKKIELPTFNVEQIKTVITYKDELFTTGPFRYSNDKGHTFGNYYVLRSLPGVPDFIDYMRTGIDGYAYDNMNGLYLVFDTYSDMLNKRIILNYFVPERDTVLEILNFPIRGIPDDFDPTPVKVEFLYIMNNNKLFFGTNYEAWIYDIESKTNTLIKFVDSLIISNYNGDIKQFRILFADFVISTNMMKIYFSIYDGINNTIFYRYSLDNGKNWKEDNVIKNCIPFDESNSMRSFNSIYFWNQDDYRYMSSLGEPLYRYDRKCNKKDLGIGYNLYSSLFDINFAMMFTNKTNLVLWGEPKDSNLYYSNNNGDKFYKIYDLPIPKSEISFSMATVFTDGSLLMTITKKGDSELGELYYGTPKPVSVNNHAVAGNMIIYPNPAGNFITLSESDTKLYTNYEIYDISGRLLQKAVLNSFRIDISLLERGSYYLRLLSPSGIATAGFLKME